MGSRVHGALVSACLLCLNLSAVAPLAGQRSTFPERPRLAASADTNDAAAYYRLGKEQLRRTPKLAAQAFYWATRLDPTSAEAFYARRIGILLEEPNLVLGYLDREKHAMRSRAARTADSLYQRALMMEPFLVRTLDRALWDGYGEQWAREVERSTRLNDPGALRYDIDRFLKQASPELRALYSYTEGNYPDAVRNYGIALQRRRYKGWLYAQRAHVQFVSGHLAEAESDLGLAMQEARKADEKDVVYFYESKANYEFALGYIMEASGRTSEALEAYGRALQEDLSYYPAHRRMAGLALARHDTAAALGALALAAAIESADAGTRLEYATLLLRTRAYADAEAQLVALTAAEPWFAPPYAMLGLVRQTLCRAEPAIEAYTAFLERARRADPARAGVERQIATLRAGNAGGGC